MKLIQTTVADLETLFQFQTNAEGIRMAAFTAKDPNDKVAYIEKWTKIVNNPDIRMQTIWLNEKIVGSVVHFDMMNETNVSYWIDQPFWGQGIATKALQLFMTDSPKTTFFGRVAFDNYGSQKVLERCGFQRISTETGFANGRNTEIEEFIYRFDK